MSTIKSLLVYFLSLLGLCGFGIIVFEILKKWQFINASLNPVWMIGAIFILFNVRQATTSPYWIDKLSLSQIIVKRITILIDTFLIVLGIVALISIPFLWKDTGPLRRRCHHLRQPLLFCF